MSILRKPFFKKSFVKLFAFLFFCLFFFKPDYYNTQVIDFDLRI